MSIDEIPEMQLTIFNKNDRLIFPFNLNSGKDYHGLFLHIHNEKDYLFAVNGLDRNSEGHTELLRQFKLNVVRNYGVDERDVSNFIAYGGGELDIRNNKIMFHGESGNYGRYLKSSIEPIAERFRDDNLPDYQLFFL